MTIARRQFEGARVVEVVPAVPIELAPPREVVAGPVPTPEPGEVLARSLRVIAAISVPLDIRGNAQNAAAPVPPRQQLCREKGPNGHPHAIVDIRLPSDRLLSQTLPTHKDVVWRFALNDPLQLPFEVEGCSH